MHWGIRLPCAIWHLYAMTLSQMSSHLALPLSQQVHNLQILMLNLQYLLLSIKKAFHYFITELEIVYRFIYIKNKLKGNFESGIF